MVNFLFFSNLEGALEASSPVSWIMLTKLPHNWREMIKLEKKKKRD